MEDLSASQFAGVQRIAQSASAKRLNLGGGQRSVELGLHPETGKLQIQPAGTSQYQMAMTGTIGPPKGTRPPRAPREPGKLRQMAGEIKAGVQEGMAQGRASRANPAPHSKPDDWDHDFNLPKPPKI